MSSKDFATNHAQEFIELRNEGNTYAKIGEMFGFTQEAVRSAIRRETGALKTISISRPMDAPVPVTDAKIFVFDIETAPMNVDVFQLKVAGYINADMVNRPGRMISWAGKFLDGPMLFSSEWTHGHQNMVETLWHAIDEADILVTYNGDSFDIKYINKEFLLAGLGKPRPFRSIDLIKVVRSNFRFDSNKLDFISQQLMDDHKTEHGGWSLWRGVMDGNPDDQALMKKYNIHDVELTVKLYFEMRPWIKNHPVVKYELDEDLGCRACGSTHQVRVGWKYAVTTRFPLYQCQECKSYARTTKGGERISVANAAA